MIVELMICEFQFDFEIQLSVSLREVSEEKITPL